MQNDDLELYRALIMDHARSPLHWGLLDPADFDHEESNPLCGDHLHLTLRIDAEGIIRAVGWDGNGCAISQASASMLGDMLVGMVLRETMKLQRETVLDMIGLKLTPSRMKCALLSLKVLLVGAAGVTHWEAVEDRA